MKQQQQWRPKVKAQCTNSVETESLKSPSSAWDNLKAVVQKLATDEKPTVEKFSSSVKVDEKLIEVINRKRKKTKRRIETDTKTSLSISKVKGGCFVEITGSLKENVDLAAAKLQALMQTGEDATDVAKDKPSTVQSSKALGSGTLQWKPKAVLGLHTSAGAVETREEELFSGSVEIDKKLLRLVKGKKNEVKKRIEEETNTTLHIASPLVVKGTSEEAVQKALAEIQKAVEEAVNDTKFQYSHFVSLPLSVHPALVKELEDFQFSVLTSLGIPLTDDPAAEQAESPDEEFEVADLKASSDEKTDAENQDSETATLTSGDKGVLDAVFKQTVASSLNMELGKDEVEALNSSNQEVEAEVSNEPDKDGVEEVVKAEEKVVILLDADNMQADDTEVQNKDATYEQKLPDILLDIKASTEAKYEPIQEVPMAVKQESKSGVEKSIFIKPTRFHLTVLMLKLWNDERVNQASEVLQKCLPDVAAALEGKPVSVSLQGLEIMRGSPKNTRVLYAKVSEAGEGNRLSQACRVLINAFIESGLVLAKDREQELKLHATVMNTSHRRSKSKFKNKGFDATEIIEKYGEANWGDYQIIEAHLSQRFKYDENDYYHCCSCIPFTGVTKPDASDDLVTEDK